MVFKILVFALLLYFIARTAGLSRRTHLADNWTLNVVTSVITAALPGPRNGLQQDIARLRGKIEEKNS